jgi:hypothetical protein
LSEWRAAAACERKYCKPDGYGCYVRGGQAHGFFLEYDRGTEPTWKYRAKFRAYARYRDSGDAGRDYAGFPTVLFVTTKAAAESRIADAAQSEWFARGAESPVVLVTSTERIRQDREGILGRIWRNTAPARFGTEPERRYWLSGGPPGGRFAMLRQPTFLPQLHWQTATDARRGAGRLSHPRTNEVAQQTEADLISARLLST